ncbi:hypothetical protein F2P81_022011 [Scophthalmus maximus]|uniref:Uncharacterized protein n=1 Tax=Scophthalmus maximus TaxID=52904 RepID=A0A6A4S0H6_SCOMX|nr:hypothetical protein F2P81_022011 [Scophthalmus maximus]
MPTPGYVRYAMSATGLSACTHTALHHSEKTDVNNKERKVETDGIKKSDECFLFQSTYPAPSDGEAWGISGDLQRSSEDEETLFQPERMMLHAASQLTDLQCQQDEAIAYIMGCPCSDDDSSQSDESPPLKVHSDRKWSRFPRDFNHWTIAHNSNLLCCKLYDRSRITDRTSRPEQLQLNGTTACVSAHPPLSGYV